jgi:predicted nucleic acid-binding protein
MPVKIYIDNSVIGRLADIDRGIRRTSRKLNDDTAVLPELFSRCAQSGIEVCTSDETIREIEQVRADMPRLADMLTAKCTGFTILSVRHYESQTGEEYGRSVMYNNDMPGRIGVVTEKLYEFLLGKTRITRESKRQAVRADAYHLAVCKYHNCMRFITCDYASVWAYRRLLKQYFDIHVCRPVELCEELRKNDSAPGFTGSC